MGSAGVSAMIGVVIIGGVFLAAAVVFVKFADAAEIETVFSLVFGLVGFVLVVWLALNASPENVHNVWRAVRDGVITFVQAAWHWLAN